ncbi:MAG: hypothetical protein JO065_12750 [Acidobacteria bacterium]|nr:hypothetical protein [Acidobacteriota bacterium]MBV9434954.1 hypothetical protein [Acidobacteriota bacterium]
MYCNSCGSALQPDQSACGRCGTAVVGRIVLNRVEHHVKLLGILWTVYAVFEAIGACVLFIIANTIFGRYNGDHPAFLHPLMTGIAIFLLIKGALSLMAGIGLIERQRWGRVLSLVMAFIALLNLPFGTALGVYTLWVLMSPQAEAQYLRMATSA